MKKALIRLEDVGPGGYYGTEESLEKLKIIIDYLRSEGVAYHISVIPRYVDAVAGYDKSIADIKDPYIELFNRSIKYCSDNRHTLGVHGYTHQYGNSVSGNGYEFAYAGCSADCPPADPPQAGYDKNAFENSYASQRMREAFRSFKTSGLDLNWGFSTPHYRADDVQRCIIEAWAGLLFEPDPYNPTKREMAILDIDHPFYRGVIYVPTPLEYVSSSNPESDVLRICGEIKNYQEQEIAAFFYHPYLEFPFINMDQYGNISYDDNSYLKRIIRCFKENSYSFTPLLSLFNFVPGGRMTDFYGGNSNILYTGRIGSDNKTGLLIRQPDTGSWYLHESNLENFPCRQCGFSDHKEGAALTNWAVGNNWVPLPGDFNGDGIDDIAVWNPYGGDWQVAINNGFILKPEQGRGDYSWLKPWALGNYWIPLIGDFNGDGKDDIVVWNPYSGDWQVALSNGSQFIPHPGRGDYSWLKPWALGNYWIPLIGDFNGDGKEDIVVWNPYSGDWQVALSNGSQFIPHPGRGDYSWLKPWALGNHWVPLIGDFNGDKRFDIAVVNIARGDWQVALSDSARFIPWGESFGPWAADSNGQPYAGDFNGDGKWSIMSRNPVLRNGCVDVAVSVILEGI